MKMYSKLQHCYYRLLHVCIRLSQVEILFRHEYNCIHLTHRYAHLSHTYIVNSEICHSTSYKYL